MSLVCAVCRPSIGYVSVSSYELRAMLASFAHLRCMLTSQHRINVRVAVAMDRVALGHPGVDLCVVLRLRVSEAQTAESET